MGILEADIYLQYNRMKAGGACPLPEGEYYKEGVILWIVMFSAPADRLHR